MAVVGFGTRWNKSKLRTVEVLCLAQNLYLTLLVA